MDLLFKLNFMDCIHCTLHFLLLYASTPQQFTHKYCTFYNQPMEHEPVYKVLINSPTLLMHPTVMQLLSNIIIGSFCLMSTFTFSNLSLF